jgi:hypothetical protein
MIFLYDLSNEKWREEECTGFWWGELGERDHCENPDVDERIILRWIFKM